MRVGFKEFLAPRWRWGAPLVGIVAAWAFACTEALAQGPADDLPALTACYAAAMHLEDWRIEVRVYADTTD